MLGVLLAGAVAVPLAMALPRGVIVLTGTTSQELSAAFSYGAKGRTINGFRLYYTCRGKQPELGTDLYSIVDGGNDRKPLARADADGDVSFDLRGHINQRLDDGQQPRGAGRLVVRATVTATGSRRVLKGTARVRSATCPSGDLTFRVAGRTKP